MTQVFQNESAALPSRKSLLGDVISALDSEQIPWVLMGDTRTYPDEIPTDADFVVDHSRIRRIPILVAQVAARAGVWMAQQLEHQPDSWSFILAWMDSSRTPRFFILDFCGNYCRFGRFLFKSEELLANRRPALDASNQSRGFMVAEPAAEFTYYMVKKVDKLGLDPRQMEHLGQQWALDPAGARRRIERFWTTSEVSIIARACDANDWHAVVEQLPALQESLRRHLPLSFEVKLQELGRTIRRSFNRTGLMIAFLGPDGSGKTAVIKSVRELLLPAFRRASEVHLRPHLGRGEIRKGAPVTDPYGSPPRNCLVSTIKVFYLWFDYTVGYWIKIYPAMIRTTLVLFDRYYHDLTADPRRYRFRSPMWLARIMGRFIPGPDVWIILDAPAEVLQERKQEVTEAESARQRDAYAMLGKTLPNAFIIDASQPLGDVVADIVTRALQFLADRRSRRQDDECDRSPIPCNSPGRGRLRSNDDRAGAGGN